MVFIGAKKRQPSLKAPTPAHPFTTRPILNNMRSPILFVFCYYWSMMKNWATNCVDIPFYRDYFHTVVVILMSTKSDTYLLLWAGIMDGPQRNALLFLFAMCVWEFNQFSIQPSVWCWVSPLVQQWSLLQVSNSVQVMFEWFTAKIFFSLWPSRKWIH